MRKKSLIRRLLPWVIVIAALAAFVIFVGIPLFTETEEVNENPPEVVYYEGGTDPIEMENDKLSFVMDPSTTQFVLTEKETGREWRSNPADASSDPIALSTNKDLLSATLTVTYTTNSGTVEYNNYTYSIANQNYTIDQEDGLIRVNYAVGQIEKVYIIPTAITKERYKSFTDNMKKSTKKKLESNYTLMTPEKLEKRDDKEELLAKYPTIGEQEMYLLKSDTSSNNKAKIQGYFEEAGYTMEDYETDMQLVADVSSNSGPVFNVSIEYRLEDNDLVVEIPYDSIRYKSDYPITYVSPLPMFGAAGTEADGYIVVPEGGGALLRYNNGKLSQSAYYANMYGWDYGEERLEVVSETENAFPVFGMTQDEGSFICIIEGASSYAGINADIAGRVNSYNTCYAKYNVLHSAQYNVSAKTAQLVYVYEKEIPNDTVIQRYRFLDTNSYTDMALAYGEYLREKDPLLSEAIASEEMPVSVEIVGAINKTQVKFGLPVDSVVAVTTFDEAKEMISNLLDGGVQNMSVRFSGWENGGVRQRVNTSVHVTRKLGGNSGMKSLIQEASEKNVPLYFDGINCFAYDSGLFNGFIPFNNAARFATREQAKLYNYDVITYEQATWEDAYYLVKPAYAKANTTVMLNAMKDRGVYGVAFRDIGDLLSADYNPRDTVTREEVKSMNVESLQEAKENGQAIMIRKGNDYAIGYADVITDMNLSGNNYALLDERIPFYQIALHGMKDYTGDPINLAEDYEEEFLNAVEYGAGLNFTLMNADGKILQESDYTGYYGASYASWGEKAIEMIIRYQADMKGLNQQKIVNHEILESDVRVTEYENGTKVYVNYTDEDVSTDGVTVPARDYVVKGGDA